jgi:hypothetical protein
MNGSGNEQDLRRQRQAAALRENLKRRKAQLRGRAAPPEREPGAADPGPPSDEPDEQDER